MMHQVNDLDVNNRFSWQSVLGLLSRLCGDAADISFDSRVWDGMRIPTLEARLDAPDLLCEPIVSEKDGAYLEQWGDTVVVLCEKLPEQPPPENHWFILKNGNAALIYRAFREAVRVLSELPFSAEFAWSSLPLIPLSDDAEQTAMREREAFRKRAIHTIWLRSDNDDALKDAISALAPCGSVRVQNMRTANTWIKET